MIEKCPSCGISLNQDFKFCTNCGYNLSAEKFDENEKSSGSNTIICEVCGETNDSNNSYCHGCGAKLPGGKNQPQNKKSFPETSSASVGKKRNLHSTGQTAKIESLKSSQSRSLSRMQIMLIVIVAFGITLILLITSGIFDETTVPANIPQVQQNSSSGIDLSAMNEINALEEKVKANPDDLQSLLHLAHLKNDAGLYDAAIISYKNYLDKNPSDADARVDMGVCYYNLKDYNSAITEMKKALEYKPDHQIAHLNLGIVNLTAGNLEESKKWFKLAVDLDPNSEVGKRAKELLESH